MLRVNRMTRGVGPHSFGTRCQCGRRWRKGGPEGPPYTSHSTVVAEGGPEGPPYTSHSTVVAEGGPKGPPYTSHSHVGADPLFICRRGPAFMCRRRAFRCRADL